MNKSNLEGHGIEKKFLLSNIIDIYSRLEVLLGLKTSDHTNTLTEASNLIHEVYKIGETQNEQQNRNALDKFVTNYIELLSKILAQIAHNTRPETEERMLIGMDKSTHEEQLSQPFKTNKNTI